jgi:hypothetical protein
MPHLFIVQADTDLIDNGFLFSPTSRNARENACLNMALFDYVILSQHCHDKRLLTWFTGNL